MSSSPRSSIRRWWLATIAMAAAVPLALCGPAVAGGGGGGHGGGGNAEHGDSSDKGGDNGKHKGQVKDHADRGKHKGHSKSRRDHSDRGKHKGQTKDHGDDKGQTKDKGKTTICHSTGSSKNPYVMITVSNSALKAHARHHGGRDIIPAPAGGCPKGDTAPAGGDKDKDKGHGKGKVTICHATGSATNPYVEITISESAVKAHRRHQNGEDIIPAPAGGCPTAAAAPVTALTAPAAPAGGVLGETFSGGGPTATAPTTAAPRAGAAPQGAVLGERASGVGPEAAAGDIVDAAPATAGSLPFTGIDLVLVALAALGCLLAGFALKRSLGGRAA